MNPVALTPVPDPIRPLLDEYATLVCRYIHAPTDADRERAHAIGRQLIETTAGADLLLNTHADALRRCAHDPCPANLERAHELLDAASKAYISDYRRQAEINRMEADCYRRYAHMLERLNGHITDLNQDLAHQREELRRAHAEQLALNQQKSDLLNVVGHEIRTPLTALLGYGEFLEEGTYGSLTPEQEHVLHQMMQSGRDLLLLINNLLDTSRLEAGRLSLDRQPVNLAELATQAIEQVRPLAMRKGLTLEATGLPVDLPPLWADPLRVLQILVNLLGNAIKFTETGGAITLGAHLLESEALPRMAEVWVRDTGIGISEEAQKRLFMRFTQVENVRRYGGTGLGLAISKELIALHGGEIRVESEPGKGATFRFTLPVWDEQDHPPVG